MQPKPSDASMLAAQSRTRLEPDTKEAASLVVDFLLDHQTTVEEKRAVLNLYGTSCAAVQALLDTIPAADIYRRRAFWFVYDELTKMIRRRRRTRVH